MSGKPQVASPGPHVAPPRRLSGLACVSRLQYELLVEQVGDAPVVQQFTGSRSALRAHDRVAPPVLYVLLAPPTYHADE